MIDESDLIDTRFNMIRVVSYLYKKDKTKGKGYYHYYNCQCECGNELILSRMQIINKTKVNCGCNKLIKKSRKTERIGEINKNKQGLNMEIIKYENSKNIDVKFEDGYIARNRCYHSFKNGILESPFLKKKNTDIGYMGSGIYNFKEYKKIYNTWKNMLRRCYLKEEMGKHPSYIDCSVCEEWHNYQNFAKWYEENYWGNNTKLQLDKDILIKGNKEYSPNTCVFVNKYINCLFTKSNNTRGDFPIGVSLYDVKDKRYMARYNENGKLIKIGVYDNPNDAFNAYKLFKEKYIKQIADEYKNKYKNFPQKLYDAMYNYEVEITD